MTVGGFFDTLTGRTSQECASRVFRRQAALWLCQLGDHKVGRDRAGATGRRRDGQCCGGAFRVADSQQRVYSSSFYDGHTHDLGCAGGASDHRIGQICSVQGQNELPGFCDTNLEQDLVDANITKGKRTFACPGDAGAAVWTVLGEADIFTWGNGVGVVRGHKGVEICIAQHTASRTCRPSFTYRTLRTGRPGFTYRTLRTDRPGFTYRTLRTGRPGCTHGSGFTYRPLWTGRPGFTNRPLWTCRSGSTNRSLGTGRSGCTHGSGFTYRPLGAYGAGHTGRALRANRPGFSCRTLWTYRAGSTYRSLRTGRSGNPRGTLRTNGSGFSGRTLGAHRPRYSRRTGRTSRSGYAAGTLRSYRTLFPDRPLRTHRSGNTFRTPGANRASWTGNALWSCRSSWPNRSLRTGGAGAAAIPEIRAAVVILRIPFAGVVIKLWLGGSSVVAVVSVQQNSSSLLGYITAYAFLQNLTLVSMGWCRFIICAVPDLCAEICYVYL